ncbi:MAG: hypothetical protein ACPGJS_12985 [Flammeovirgaceae bacterium]
MSFLLCCCFSATAQELSPKGWFHQDEAKLGEPIHYSLVLEHRADVEFYFPDSTHDFSPFEYLSRAYFPTQTDSLGNSYDSVVYTLATFELGKVQYLSVPMFLKGEKNPRPLAPAKDSIQLVELIQELPDSVSLFENTTAATVEKEFNRPLLITILISLILLGLFIYIVLGDSIRNFFAIRKMRQRHLDFVLAFDQQIYEGGQQEIEPAISLWKNYSGSLMNIPLGSYTTKEISRTIPEEQQVIDVLKQADKAIYAGEVKEDIKKKLVVLKTFSQKVYEKQVAQTQKQGGTVAQLPPLLKWLPAIPDKFGHITLYSTVSFLIYLLVFLWNDENTALIFPFMSFLIISYLAIIAFKEKQSLVLSLKEVLILLYGQCGVTGLFISIMYGVAYVVLGDKLGLLHELTSIMSPLLVMLIIPIGKSILVSMKLPLYYLLFNQKENQDSSDQS